MKKYGLNLSVKGAFDFLSLGALVHRVDPGIVPFSKASEWQVHPSGGEYNVTANLANCFRLRAILPQAQRDYFGAHTYRRIDCQGTFHTEWTSG